MNKTINPLNYIVRELGAGRMSCYHARLDFLEWRSLLAITVTWSSVFPFPRKNVGFLIPGPFEVKCVLSDKLLKRSIVLSKLVH